MKLVSAMMIGVLGLLTGCSSMNASFSCNETASDRCLSIEEVDRMTSFADDYNKAPYPSKFGSKRLSANNSRIDSQKNSELVWVAPWKDKQGIAHKEQVIKGNQTQA